MEERILYLEGEDLRLPPGKSSNPAGAGWYQFERFFH
jgi:hypothetical protein